VILELAMHRMLFVLVLVGFAFPSCGPRGPFETDLGEQPPITATERAAFKRYQAELQRIKLSAEQERLAALDEFLVAVPSNGEAGVARFLFVTRELSR
jgi:hypothetical protein